MSTLWSVVGEEIRRLRVARGMTQVELGRLVGLSNAAISRLEAGLTSTGLRRLDRFDSALGGITARIAQPRVAASSTSADAPETRNRATGDVE